MPLGDAPRRRTVSKAAASELSLNEQGRRGAITRGASMSHAVLGIDVAKVKCDVVLLHAGKTRHKVCPNTAAGFTELAAWLQRAGIERVHACLEADRRLRRTARPVVACAGPRRQCRQSRGDSRVCRESADACQNRQSGRRTDCAVLCDGGPALDAVAARIRELQAWCVAWRPCRRWRSRNGIVSRPAWVWPPSAVDSGRADALGARAGRGATGRFATISISIRPCAASATC